MDFTRYKINYYYYLLLTASGMRKLSLRLHFGVLLCNEEMTEAATASEGFWYYICVNYC